MLSLIGIIHAFFAYLSWWHFWARASPQKTPGAWFPGIAFRFFQGFVNISGAGYNGGLSKTGMGLALHPWKAPNDLRHVLSTTFDALKMLLFLVCGIVPWWPPPETSLGGGESGGAWAVCSRKVKSWKERRATGHLLFGSGWFLVASELVNAFRSRDWQLTTSPMLKQIQTHLDCLELDLAKSPKNRPNLQRTVVFFWGKFYPWSSQLLARWAIRMWCTPP